MLKRMSTTVETAAPARRIGPTFSLQSLMVGMLAASVLLAALWYVGRAMTKARQAAQTSSAQAPLNQLMLALSIYHDIHGEFPPAYIADEDGKPMHSWRVLVLPYIGHEALFKAYRFDQPWNGPQNLALASRMPTVFRSPTEPHSFMHTNMVVVVGPDTAFPGARTTKIDSFTDGPENCILVTEIADSDICWLEPRDLDAATMSFTVNDRTKPSISAIKWRRPYVVFADSIHAYQVPEDLSPKKLKALTTIAGGEPVTRDQIWPDNP